MSDNQSRGSKDGRGTAVTPEDQLASLLKRRLRLPLADLDATTVEGYGRDLGELAGSLPRLHDAKTAEYSGHKQEGTTAPLHQSDEATRRAPQTLHEYTIEALAPLLERHEVGVGALAKHMLDRIGKYEPRVRAHTTVARDSTLEQATRLDEDLARSHWRGPLHGIPIGVKDSIPVAGLRWTANSRLYENRWAIKDAEAIANLRRAGVIFIGKHNLNEFGWSIPNENDLTPPPRNPWNPSEYSVGSSSGSGAAVSARLAFGAVCTDGGGSARLPAGQHGLFALKPSHEGVPRAGYTDRTLSEISFLARSAPDVAMLFAAARTPTTTSVQELAASISGARDHVNTPKGTTRIGIPRDLVESIEPETDVLDSFKATAERIREGGYEVVPIPAEQLFPLPLRTVVAANFVVLCAEAYADHATALMEHASGYGDSARHYISQGAFLSADDYLNALSLREGLQRHFRGVFKGIDALLLPTSPVTTTRAARDPKTHRKGGNAMFTAPFNLAGLPATSLPAGLSATGIPMGMQLVGPEGSELDLLRLAHAVYLPPTYPDLDRQGLGPS